MVLSHLRAESLARSMKRLYGWLADEDTVNFPSPGASSDSQVTRPISVIFDDVLD